MQNLSMNGRVAMRSKIVSLSGASVEIEKFISILLEFQIAERNKERPICE